MFQLNASSARVHVAAARQQQALEENSSSTLHCLQWGISWDRGNGQDAGCIALSPPHTPFSHRRSGLLQTKCNFDTHSCHEPGSRQQPAVRAKAMPSEHYYRVVVCSNCRDKATLLLGPPSNAGQAGPVSMVLRPSWLYSRQQKPVSVCKSTEKWQTDGNPRPTCRLPSTETHSHRQEMRQTERQTAEEEQD